MLEHQENPDERHRDSASPSQASAGRKSVPLRRRLLLLGLAAILPAAAMSGIGLAALEREQVSQVERVGIELARALAIAVDAELRGTTSVLEALATSVALDHGDRRAFLGRARRVLDTQHNWEAVLLADPSGTRLADTRFPADAPLPPLGDRGSLETVLRTRAPAVGNLARDAHDALLFSVSVPVVRQGGVRYVLSAVVKPDAILAVIRRQRVPSSWVISVFDASGLRVARSRAHAENLGGRAAPSLEALMGSGTDEGVGQTYALEGDRIYTSYSRIKSSGWIVAPGIPAALVEGAAHRSLVVYGSGILLSIALGMAMALWVARSINRPIGDLRASAQALGRREPLSPPATSIQELRDVGTALAVAGQQLARIERQREDLLHRERDARETAETAARAKDEFLAVLSHELRTPLNAVYGWARMLQAGQVPPEHAAQAIDAIVRNASAQVQLIDDLLDIARVISGKMRLDVRLVDLKAVVEAALDAVRPAAEAKEIHLEPVLDPRAGPIAGDASRLQQVVWNLLMNAVKFTPKRGRVQVHLQRVNSHLEIRVSDTGEGIAAHVLPYVFDRFQQGDSSSTRGHSGLGLGLALVKHLVELHGGHVTAHSAGKGQGATFVVQLPVAVSEVVGAARRRHPTAPDLEGLPGGMRLDGVHVLVIDDDPESLHIASAILTGAGATVRTSPSASAGLAAFLAWRPDVLVSDIEMPAEDGYSLIRKIRALGAEEGGRTPAVALTAYGRTQDRVASLTAGYTMHVPKPVDPGEFTTIIASIAGRSAA
jgi:signal transduction histidine kinase/ActR/RegA family two-component response regulator